LSSPVAGEEIAPPRYPPMESPLCAKVAGFSLHAARVVGAADRDGLERLCRYGLRAPFSQERLSLRGDGRVIYRLRRPWPNAAGATCLVLTPTDLLRRLAALVPAPYSNMVRYHGVFANRSRWRARLPAPPGRNVDGGTASEADAEPDEDDEPATNGDGRAIDATLPEQDNRPRRRPLRCAPVPLPPFSARAG